MTEHRVPMLGAALRRHVDPARSTDPKIRELVGALAGLEVAPAPRAQFRAELRAQLVAVTPRLVAEGEPQPAAASAKRPERAPKAERARGFRFAKPLIAAACVLTAFVLLLGGAVLISRHALPGDALYGIKRASENTEYSLTGGEVAKGKLKLEFAARRIGEVDDLLPRANALSAGAGAIADSGAINSDTTALVRDTLASARGDVESAAQMLGSNAVRNDNAAPLTALVSWSPTQIGAMRQIVARIPAGPLHTTAAQTLGVLRQAEQRATALSGELGCSCLNTSNSDNFGPIPCTGPCSTVAPTPARRPNAHPSTKARPHGSGTAVRPGRTASTPVTPVTKTGSVNATATPPHPIAHPPSTAGTGTGSKSPINAPTSPTIPIPTLPLHGGTGSGSGHGASPPVSVNSCGVTIGDLTVGTGGC